MVYMRPRKQVLPMPQRSLRTQFLEGFAPIFPRSDERPSIFGSDGLGRGVQGEHSNGRNSAIEMRRSHHVLNKPFKK